MRQAIVGPAQARGVSFESEAMIQQLVTAGIEGSLPLLQFALSELWEARASDSSTIAVAALNKIGGVAGALARHAEGVLARLTPLQRRAARSLLLRLITIEETRASLNYDKLAVNSDDARIALDALLDARLLLIRDLAEGPPVYEIAHEALIRGWVSLQVWLNEETEKPPDLPPPRAHRRRVGTASAARRTACGARASRTNPRLDPRNLRAHEAAFLAASAAFHHRARRLRLGLLVGAPLLIALGVVVALLILRAALQREIDDRLGASRQLIAEAQAIDREVEAHRAAAFAAFDRGDKADGEAAWHLAVRAAPGVQRLLVRAASGLKTAHGLDSARDNVRRALADVLVLQAALAERDHDPSLAEALLLRVAVHDADGTRMTRWRAPARVDLRSEPAGARVRAARYERDSEGQLHLGPAHELGVTPLTEHRARARLISVDNRRRRPRRAALPRAAAPRRTLQRRPRTPGPGREIPDRLCLYSTRPLPGRQRRRQGSAPQLLHRHPAAQDPQRRLPHRPRQDHLRRLARVPRFAAARRAAKPQRPTRGRGVPLGAAAHPRRGRLADGACAAATLSSAPASPRPIHIPRRQHHAEQDWLRWPITGIS